MLNLHAQMDAQREENNQAARFARNLRAEVTKLSAEKGCHPLIALRELMNQADLWERFSSAEGQTSTTRRR
jgi:hypothetical protein